MSRINLGDYRFFLGGCKIFGLFGLFFGLGLLVLIFVVFWESGFARGATYFFFASPKKK